MVSQYRGGVSLPFIRKEHPSYDRGGVSFAICRAGQSLVLYYRCMNDLPDNSPALRPNGSTTKQILEDFVQNADPNGMATYIITNPITDLSEGEQREYLAQAFSQAAVKDRSEDGGGGFDGGSFGDRELSGKAMDLRLNLGGIGLKEHIYIFYPYLRPKK